MARVFVTRRLPGGQLEALARRHEVVVHPDDAAPDHATLVAEAGRSDALVTLLSDRIDDAVLGAGVRVVANYAVGVDNIDLAAARRHGVLVANTPDVLTDASADLAFALLLAAARRLPEAGRMVAEGRFSGWAPSLLLGQPVAGRVLGVVGPGRIGRAVLARGRGFGMDLVYHGRRASPEAEALGARRVTLDALLAGADFVSLHVPLTGATRHLLGADELARMKPSAVLVNTARGPVVDEAALAEALARGRIFAAGLDVFEAEPEVHPGLLGLPNVVLAPHLGSATTTARAEMARLCCEAVDTALAGGTPPNVVVDPRP